MHSVEATAIDTRTEQLIANVRRGVGTVVLNNPARRNALSREMLVNLPDVLSQLQANPSVRVIVLEGAGDKAFAAGADLAEVGTGNSGSSVEALEVVYERMLLAVRSVRIPVIAMINGVCLGGGLELALAADLRYTGPNSTFGIPAAKLGIAYSKVDPLIAVIGPSCAAELLFTGRTLDAEEAVTTGLVNRVFPTATLRDEVHTIAGSIADNAPMAVAAVKVALREATKCTAERNDTFVDSLVAACLASNDFAEGRQAFLEKRRPHFQGR
jgi:enoyl-CoA hydratase